MNRFEVLNDLINLSRTPEVLAGDLSKFDWDYEGGPFVIKAAQVQGVLERFLAGKYSARQLEDWANLIECREDLSFEESKHEEIENIIDSLANPSLQGDITLISCKALLDSLS